MDVTKPIDDVIIELSELIATRARVQARSVPIGYDSISLSHQSLTHPVCMHPV